MACFAPEPPLGRYRQPYEIAEDRSLAWRIVRLVAGSESNPRPKQSGSGSAANETLRRPAEQIVRFARPKILFYDEHVIDLCPRICALYRMGGEDTETKGKSYAVRQILSHNVSHGGQKNEMEPT